VIVRGAPAWAQQRSGSACGPIRESALDEFATFVAELARRYSQPPFNVRYWELGNEPDVDAALVPGNSPFGCWGDAEDEFYGGGYYAEMLKTVYPAIKAANPDAQVVLGGLLLDCDPGVPLPDGQPCVAGKFFEGVLRNGGGAAFDVANYHAYVYWADGNFDWDTGLPKWQHRAGVPVGKLAYLRETMARYGVEKPVMLSEAGLLCFRADPSCEPNGFRDDQANYAVRLYTRSAANGLIRHALVHPQRPRLPGEWPARPPAAAAPGLHHGRLLQQAARRRALPSRAFSRRSGRLCLHGRHDNLPSPLDKQRCHGRATPTGGYKNDLYLSRRAKTPGRWNHHRQLCAADCGHGALNI
ncbi:glycoside hydrolase family 5 protein, partial [Candidatus Gracilibacteria bacterium]|nr:glycoside hydrolase family 5 protein [Candidatus Gracilibacteria bacterium]